MRPTRDLIENDKTIINHPDPIARIARNAVFFLITKLLEVSGTLVSTSIIARYLGVKDFGEYSFVIAFVTLALSFSHSGFELLVVRELAKNKEEAPAKFGTIMLCRWLLLAASMVILALVTMFLTVPPVIKLAVIITAVSHFTFSTGNLINSVFRAYERMYYESFVTFLFRIVMLALLVAVALFNLGFVSVFLALTVANFFRTFISAHLMRKSFIKPVIALDYAACRSILKDSLVIGLGAIIMFGAARIDILLLKAFRMPDDVALFSAPFNIILQLQALPLVAVTALFPAMSISSKDSMSKIYKNASKLLIVIVLPVIAAVFVLSGEIIHIIYGKRFIEAAAPLRIMIWGTLFLFLGMLFDHILIALNKQRYVTVSAASCLAVNALLDLLLIPKYGYNGAAIGTLGSFPVLCGVSFYYVYREFGGLDVGDALLKPFLSAAVMFAVIYLSGTFLLPLRLGFGISAYTACLVLTKAVSKEYLLTLKRRVK